MNKVIGLTLMIIFSFLIFLSIALEISAIKILILITLLELFVISKNIMLNNSLRETIAQINIVLMIRLFCGILFLIFAECLIKNITMQSLEPAYILMWLMLSIISLGAIVATFIDKKINFRNV